MFEATRVMFVFGTLSVLSSMMHYDKKCAGFLCNPNVHCVAVRAYDCS